MIARALALARLQGNPSERGIYVTIAAYPLVPKDEVGFRIQLTAANTDAEVDHLNAVLGELAERFQIQTRE